MTKYRRLLLVIWSIIRDLIELVIVLGIFAAISGRFEIIVASMLVLIYTGVARGFASLAITSDLDHFRREALYFELRKTLGKPVPTSERTEMETEKKESEWNTLEHIISVIITALINLIAIWKLLRAIQWF